ncbi:hypothetical protein [Geomicrobium sp. JCM 19055]|uniref:hypothetical protein n=1 Tax=Geomicrobium sp. JCM 19055 TaxID=1460649 RepID=UPI0005A9C8FF|nr:hypothetical protein [Geomicrobium sp. JCM 19055]
MVVHTRTPENNGGIDPDTEKIVSICDGCLDVLRKCDEFIEWEDEHYCNEECLLDRLSYKKVTGFEIKEGAI